MPLPRAPWQALCTTGERNALRQLVGDVAAPTVSDQDDVLSLNPVVGQRSSRPGPDRLYRPLLGSQLRSAGRIHASAAACQSRTSTCSSFGGVGPTRSVATARADHSISLRRRRAIVPAVNHHPSPDVVPDHTIIGTLYEHRTDVTSAVGLLARDAAQACPQHHERPRRPLRGSDGIPGHHVPGVAAGRRWLVAIGHWLLPDARAEAPIEIHVIGRRTGRIRPVQRHHAVHGRVVRWRRR